MDSLSLRLVGPGSLYEAFRAVPDPRKSRGISYRKVAGLLTLIVAAVLAGQRNYMAITQWIAAVPQELLGNLGCVRVGRTGRYRAPSEPTVRRMIKRVNGDDVDRAASQWLLAQGVSLPGTAIAIDGKTLRGSHDGDLPQVHLLSALTHREGVVIAQCQIPHKTNEIPAAREMFEDMDLEGRIVTADAMHTQTATADMIIKKKGTSS